MARLRAGDAFGGTSWPSAVTIKGSTRTVALVVQPHDLQQILTELCEDKELCERMRALGHFPLLKDFAPDELMDLVTLMHQRKV